MNLPQGIYPRPYQVKTVELLRASFQRKNKKVVLCLTTGGGKTFIFAITSHMACQKENSQVLIMVDQEELLGQASETLKKFELEHDFIYSGYEPMQGKQVYVAMVETMANRKYEWLKPTLVIIDEAHMGTFIKVHEWFPDAYFMGVTATPIYADDQRVMNQDYDDIIVPITTQELIDLGFVKKPKYYVNKFTAHLETNRKKDDFTAKSLSVAFDNPESIATILRDYQTHCVGKRTLIYCVSVRHAKKVQMAFKEFGYECRLLSSETPKPERRALKEWLNQTPNAIIVNVAVLTKGFDAPAATCEIIARAIFSLTLWIQIAGRITRPHPGKDEAIIIDHGGNLDRHREWEYPHDWEKKFFAAQPKSKGGGDAPVKQCQSCEAWNYASARVCRVCGQAFPEKEKQAVIGETVAYNGKPAQTPAHLQKAGYLMGIARKKKFKLNWVLHQLKQKHTRNEVFEAATMVLKYKDQDAVWWLDKNYNEPK